MDSGNKIEKENVGGRIDIKCVNVVNPFRNYITFSRLINSTLFLTIMLY